MGAKVLAQEEHPLTAETKLVVSHGTWRKHDYVDVRVYWLSNPDEIAAPKWLPTKKGVRLQPDLARNLTLDLERMLGLAAPSAPKNGNGKRPRRNGGNGGFRLSRHGSKDGTYIAGPTPPRNAKGGFKCGPSGLPWPRKRHDGVRCYGDHVGSKCYPYDFSREPTITWAGWAFPILDIRCTVPKPRKITALEYVGEHKSRMV